MKKSLFYIAFLMLFLGVSAQSDYSTSFDKAYKLYPQIPRGCLEAVAFNNTHVNHLTDMNYTNNDSTAMPRSYGVMGLVLDGKGWFRNNLQTISDMSGFSVGAILNSADSNIIAYASAFASMMKMYVSDNKRFGVEDLRPVFVGLSELPLPEKDVEDDFVLNTMLYSVYYFLNDEALCDKYNVKPYKVDFYKLFGKNIKQLTAEGLIVKDCKSAIDVMTETLDDDVAVAKDGGASVDGPDYIKAIWKPAPECNYAKGRGGATIHGVVIHYTEGSYAGAISWFLNCQSSVSSHYIIRSVDGQVTQMVHESDKAWHARSANAYTIGIEHEAYGDIISYFTDAMYRASADLVKDICRRNQQILPYRMFYRDTLDDGTALDYGVHSLGDSTACIMIRGHQHYPGQSHTDPGPYWNWNYYYKLVNDNINVTEFDSDSGTFYDSGGQASDYGDDERRGYLIHYDEAKSIRLTFSEFNLEKDNDFIWIYDGPSVFSPLIGRWNTRSPGKVQSSGNSIFVEFRSDCAITASGWTASWKAIMPIEVISVYPNPAGDFVKIEVPERFFPLKLSVYSETGNILEEKEINSSFNTLDISGLPNGVLIFNFTKGELNLRRMKIIKFAKNFYHEGL